MNDQRRQPLRYIILGVAAGIFHSHLPALQQPDVQVVGVADLQEEVGRARAHELNAPFYLDYKKMLAEVQGDVALLLTPPFLHASMALDCFAAGYHVLTEKPIAIQIAEADQMLAAAKKHGKLLGVTFQHRERPEIQEARALIQSGRLGNIQHVQLYATWTRPGSYYRMASWRATWKGEGGGIITNQASHNLDILCYLFGSPQTIAAWTRKQLHTSIETEDTVHAMLEWPDGALGSLHITTAEMGVPESLIIHGTRGILQLGRGSIDFQEFDQDLRDYARDCEDPYGKPMVSKIPLHLERPAGGHQALYQQFHAALRGEAMFEHNGEAARQELEVANALIYSNMTRQMVNLPLESQKYADLLRGLQEQDQHNTQHEGEKII